MKIKFSNVIWGVFFLLIAALVIVNQLGFADIGIGKIIAIALAFIISLQCIAFLRFTLLPVFAAVLYYVFHASLDLPFIGITALIIASALASIGLSIIIPKKNWRCHKNFNKIKNNNFRVHTGDWDAGNNLSVSVNFGYVSRRLKAGNLETVRLDCNFGAMEIYFDQAELCPNGAEVSLNCHFGSIEILVPKHWRIVDRLHCTLGGIDVKKNFDAAPENAPQLILTGNVLFGGVELQHI